MRQVLRLLGSRYGAAAALLVAIALIVGVGKLAGGHSDLPPHSASAGAPSPVVTTSDLGDDGLGTPPSPPAPSTSPGAPDPQTVATSFTQAWLHHTGVTAQQWFDGIAPYATSALKSELTGADPGTVQASAINGALSVVARAASYVEMVVPLDSGTLTLGLSATDGRWLVSSVDWDRP